MGQDSVLSSILSTLYIVFDTEAECYGYSDTNNFYFILFYFILFFLILLFFFFTLFSWKDNEEGT